MELKSKLMFPPNKQTNKRINVYLFEVLFGGGGREVGWTLAVGLGFGSALLGAAGVRNLISRRTLPSPPITVRVIWIVFPFPVVNVVVWLLRRPSSFEVWAPSIKSSNRLEPPFSLEKNGSDLENSEELWIPLINGGSKIVFIDAWKKKFCVSFLSVNSFLRMYTFTLLCSYTCIFLSLSKESLVTSGILEGSNSQPMYLYVLNSQKNYIYHQQII